jgi:hypothetical protein
MYTLDDLSESIRYIKATSEMTRDLQLNLEMSMLYELLKFLDRTRPDWRQQVVDYVNANISRISRNDEIEFDITTFIMILDNSIKIDIHDFLM